MTDRDTLAALLERLWFNVNDAPDLWGTFAAQSEETPR